MNWRALLVLVLITQTALAQDPPIETVPPGDDKIVVVKKGEQAPYDGQLFDNATALRWAFWLQQYKFRLRVDVDQEREICIAEKEYIRKVLQAERTRSVTVEKDLKTRLSRSEKSRLEAEDYARNPPWYRSVWFGVAVGVVGTALVGGLSVAAVNSAK